MTFSDEFQQFFKRKNNNSCFKNKFNDNHEKKCIKTIRRDIEHVDLAKTLATDINIGKMS